MRDVAGPVLAGLDVQLVEVDVGEDPELERRYLLEIPVLLLGEAEIARHRTTADELRRRLIRAGITPRG
jgi:hypothetical protein